MHENNGHIRIAPTDYALPAGVPALQADPARTRRAFCAVVLASLGAGAGIGYWLWGGARRQTTVTPTTKKLEWARELAAGPGEALVGNHVLFLAIFEQVDTDPQLIDGVARLIAEAIRD